MAVTRIWAVRNNLSQVVDYASNKSKTDLSKYSDLIDALHYAADDEKTNLENEQKLLVEGINCDPDIAARQMIDTKEIYGKTGGVVAYHAYISFKLGEVSPEEAQQVAMEVANKMWGCGSPVETSAQQKHRPSREARPDYEMIVATHLNANCVHNHFCQGENEFFVSVIELLSPSIHRKPPGKNPRRQAVMFAYLILTLLTALHAE